MLRDWSDRMPEPPRESRLAIGGCAVMLVMALAVIIFSEIAPMIS
jgi:hypothetical protein